MASIYLVCPEREVSFFLGQFTLIPSRPSPVALSPHPIVSSRIGETSSLAKTALRGRGTGTESRSFKKVAKVSKFTRIYLPICSLKRPRSSQVFICGVTCTRNPTPPRHSFRNKLAQRRSTPPTSGSDSASHFASFML